MSKASAKTKGKTSGKTPVNPYEQQRLQNIEANKEMMKKLGVKRILACLPSLVDSTMANKGAKRSKNNTSLHQDPDYTPENDLLDDDNDEEPDMTCNKKVTSGVKRCYIPQQSVGKFLKMTQNNEATRKAFEVIQQAYYSQQEQDDDEQMEPDEEPIDSEEADVGNYEDSQTHENNDFADDQEMMETSNEDMLLEKQKESATTGKGKLRKLYKTQTPRGPTRNLQLAKLRPGEKIKVDFNVSGQLIGVNRAKFTSYCGSLVRDTLNAPLSEVEQFAQVPEENKEKMWKLVLDKFDIGLDEVEGEEAREKRRIERRKYVFTSLNKKYRNYRARLKREHYDIAENDEERLEEKNLPPGVDKKDWKWLVHYFGSDKFQKKSLRNAENRSYLDAGHTAGTKSFAQKAQDMFERDKKMPGLLDLYEETHTRSDKTPVTETAKETMNEIQQLLEQRKSGDTKMTDEEIYATVKPKRKTSARDRGKGISPSLTSLFGSFGEGEKLRKEAEAAKNEAAEATKKASEASEKNNALNERVKGLEKETRIMKYALEVFMSAAGYDPSSLKIDKLPDPAYDDDEANGETDNIQDDVEEFGADE